MTPRAVFNLVAAVLSRAKIWLCDPGDDPLIQRVQSNRAWARWQASVRAEKLAARAKHGRVREVERRQTELLHAALAANRHQGD